MLTVGRNVVFGKGGVIRREVPFEELDRLLRVERRLGSDRTAIILLPFR